MVDLIPEVLRAALSERYLPRSARGKLPDIAQRHRRYAPLWTSGAALPVGTIKTDSLPDEVWNPWPDKVQGLLRRCDIELYSEVEQEHGRPYLDDLKQYVEELVRFRNEVAHGDEPSPWTARDVRLRIKWVSRLARACDQALDRRLTTVTGAGW